MNPDAGFPVFFTEVSKHLGHYDQTKDDVNSISNKFPPDQFKTILDVCCGIGRFAGELHRSGYSVTGIDLSDDQLQVAEASEPGPVYLQGDMAAPPLGPYDLLVNVYTSFGYFSTEAEDLSLFKKWKNSIRPSGWLIMELANMERARNRFGSENYLLRKTGPVTEHLYMEWNRRLLTIEYTLSNRSWKCVTRLYEHEILRDAIAAAGFTDIQIFGGFDWRDKTVDDNVVILARNPD